LPRKRTKLATPARIYQILFKPFSLVSRVIDSTAVEPVRDDGDTAEVRLTFDRSRGCERLEQRVIRFDPGRSRPRSLEGRQEIMYVVSGRGTIEVDGDRHDVGAGAGVFLAAGETYAVENPAPEPLVVVSVLAPEERAPGENRKVVVRFAEQPELRADAKRTFRYLVNEDAGCRDVTQFVGIVQPCRAPDHSHSYDEVGYIIEGEGVAHIGEEVVPLRSGSCFHLPPEQVHCIENNGSTVMRILGVFHPSGDPASRSYDEAATTNG
jgi:mannose-6-phosphate isomerase-like protein (cupin superfamily)